MLETVDAIKEQRDRLVSGLCELGLEPVPSDANFVLFGHLPDAHATWQALLDRGVLVRDVGIPHYLRVTAGTPDEILERLATAVRKSVEDPEFIAKAREQLLFLNYVPRADYRALLVKTNEEIGQLWRTDPWRK